ncbi:MAG TPA: hypothetical protein VN519_13720 [Bryobacteraceae bacterium]|nr:hypothetical protein [Bryobacteraceae bacterium]
MKRRSRIALALGLFLFALNAWICHELFTADFVNNLLSNEAAFSSIGRFFREHPLDHSWFPWFNAGMAMEYAYQPLLPALSGLTAALTGWSDTRALHFILAFSYCCGPVTLFWLAWDWSESLSLSLTAALAYSLTSPAEWLVPVLRFFPGGHLGALRLNNLVFYGEGPHIVAVSMLPLAFLFLRRAIVRGGAVNIVVAGIAASALALTNAFGAFTVALGAISIVLALGRGVRPVLITGICSYLWISPWLPPSLILWIRRASWSTGGLFQSDARSHLAIPAIIVMTGLTWFLTRRLRGSFERFAILIAIWMCAIPLCYFWRDRLTLVPLASRYQLELEMAISLLLGCALRWIWTRSPSAFRIALLALLTLVGLRQAIIFRRYAAVLLKPIDITKTVEYKVVDWLARNRPRERAMVSGDPEYIFNLYTDSPQLSAGHEPTAPNWMQRVAVFIIYTGLDTGSHDAEDSIFWLKAYGAHTIYVPGPASREHYHPFPNPHKFDGILPVLWHEEDDTIFGVPQRSGSMAHVIPRDALVTRQPVNGVDLDPARAYVAALDNPSLPLARLDWTSPSRAVIDAGMAPGQLVSVQETWMQGWRATANGRPVRVFGDKLGLIVIDPNCSGPCHIDLSFGPTTEGWIVRILSLTVTFLAPLVLFVRKRASRPATKA